MENYLHRELHVFEKNNHLVWGLIIFVCSSAGTYLMANSAFFMDWSLFSAKHIGALILLGISFRGIFILSDPLYHFVLYFENRTLVIEINKGEIKQKTQRISVDDFESLKFTPHTPRKSGEAMFDFATSYHLLYRQKGETEYRRLLETESDSITLKVDDLATIMRFIKDRNSEIYIPDEQARYFNL